MKFTRKKIILGIIFIFAIGFICLLINRNTGLRAFEKEVLNIELPQKIEKIAMRSGIGDSGGNGDYSTYCQCVFSARPAVMSSCPNKSMCWRVILSTPKRSKIILRMVRAVPDVPTAKSQPTVFRLPEMR